MTTNRVKRISDQVLIFQSILLVKEELAEASVRNAGDIVTSEILTRLTSLYACIDCDRMVDVLKQTDERSRHGRAS